ncbi:MAG: carboxymuconolactone decarboxylase family protein [Thermodesulfobacteriota bacterium]
MERMARIAPEQMSPEQRQIWQDIVAERGSPQGPFNVWLRSPELASRAQRLGAQVRLHSSLPPRLSELAILINARRWNCQTEWTLHEPFARQAGLDSELIQAINQRQPPVFARQDEAAVYDFCSQAVGQGFVSDEIYARCRDLLGETALVDLVGVLGYYCLVALSLNVFQVALPEDRPPRLSDAPVF